MKRLRIWTALTASAALLSGCGPHDSIDWKTYARDYELLSAGQPDSAEVPFKASALSVRQSADSFRIVVSFDEATVTINPIRIICMPFVGSAVYDPATSRKAPFLGYNESEPIGLGPERDSLAGVYDGLNLAFASAEAEPIVRISVKDATRAWYLTLTDYGGED